MGFTELPRNVMTLKWFIQTPAAASKPFHCDVFAAFHHNATGIGQEQFRN
jgi:hypothetical protein